MSKPIILMSPGAFAMPDTYDPIIEKLRAKGVNVRGLHLLSVGPGPQRSRPGKGPSMNDDAAFIAKEVEKEADAGRNVLLMGHSYSGVPVCQCVKGLTKTERQAEGKKGGVVGLAFMTSLVPALGESAGEVFAKSQQEGKAVPMELIVSPLVRRPVFVSILLLLSGRWLVDPTGSRSGGGTLHANDPVGRSYRRHQEIRQFFVVCLPG